MNQNISSSSLQLSSPNDQLISQIRFYFLFSYILTLKLGFLLATIKQELSNNKNLFQRNSSNNSFVENGSICDDSMSTDIPEEELRTYTYKKLVESRDLLKDELQRIQCFVQADPQGELTTNSGYGSPSMAQQSTSKVLLRRLDSSQSDSSNCN